ncbi:cytidylate kinase [Candidatus Scalindua japonica]|uniref:Cytidylate kinase n=1 Tax=Candidatus Scalindua japonica TaxID=1284222 RepID=A0A286TYT1_9BACT|nr:(d)CMP kinase [Candidatus Scalindua japonica]GAX61063.1 cytidylate kinase [Candidatus Scalindua japonica]
MIIAIDGPAGSGKSTAAKGLAERLGFTYLDSGAMYRAFTWKACSSGADFSDKDGLSKLLADTSIRIECSADGTKVFVDDADVTKEIRHPSITENIHHISSLDFVRRKMVDLQRDFAKDKDIIAEGRDMCSVVFPNADKKVYMDADIQERAKRRHSELRAFNNDGSIDNVTEDIVRRDQRDSTRQFAPLKREPDALYLDTTNLDAKDVVDILIKEIEKEQQKD